MPRPTWPSPAPATAAPRLTQPWLLARNAAALAKNANSWPPLDRCAALSARGGGR
jgi:hypothetical protein